MSIIEQEHKREQEHIEQEQCKNKINNETNTFTNSITISYLTNPSYQPGLAKKMPEISQNNKEDIKFYRKRIISLMKDMLKGATPAQELKKIHDSYVLSIIEYFKMTDTRDILQEEYEDDDETGANELICENSNLDEVNKSIMKQPKISTTLDNFITSKTIKIKETTPLPKKKEINLHNIELKRKGLKKKINK